MLEHQSPKPNPPTRVVIIGAGGFIGSNLRVRLEADGVPVLPLTRNELNLLDSGAAGKLRGMLDPRDSLVMTSAAAPAKTVTMLMDNLRMAEQVAKCLVATPIAHFVYISSDAVYCDDASPVTEGSHLAPTQLHGMMHAARELVLRSSAPAPFVALRPTLVYGAGDPHNGYGPNRFRRQAARGEPIQIFGEGEEQRDHVSIHDVTAIAAMALLYRSAGALNVATGVSTSFHDIANLVAGQFGVPVVNQPRPGPRPHLTHRFFDISECRKAFPTFRYTPLAEGLEQARKGEE